MMKFRLIQYLLIVVAIILVVRCVIGGEIERLLYAAKNNDIITVKSLLAKSEGIDINAVGEDGNTALMLAASLAKIDIVKALLDAGADVNVKNKKHNTVLIIAAWHGRVNMVEALLAKGADVSVKDKYGNTALKIVRVIRINKEIARMLLKAGAVQ